MSTDEMDEAVKNVELFYSILKSINAFDEIEVKGVIDGILSPTLPEQCFIAIYYRASSNVKSLLELKHVKHFQAIGMLARSLFELTVEIRLLALSPDAPLKMLHFKDIEKLRACQSAVDFKSANGRTYLSGVDVQKGFITNEGERIKAVAASLWPNTKWRDIKHWSGKSLAERVKLLDPKFQEIYACFYRQLSWNVHAGLPGVIGLKPETFVYMCSLSYHLASLVYEILLISVVAAFRLAIHDPLIDSKMKLARYLPLTEGAEDELELRKDLNL